jgi:protein SCO1
MDRRNFMGLSLGLGLAPLALARHAHAAVEVTGKPMSTLARQGFFPNVPLVTHLGEKVRFYDDCIHDRIVLLNFFMVECTDGVCPTATANLRKVQDLLGERMGKDVFFYSITLQPKHDTPKVLRAYAANFDIKPGWKFLTGTFDDIENLRRTLGYAESDPEIDKDPANHIGMARYGDDRLNRWGGISVRSNPDNIASTFKWLSV